ITESHMLAAATGVPLLGITGDDTLATQIDGIIAGTPYLIVKYSESRATARPAHADARQTAAAIRSFAAACASRWRARPIPGLPASFTFAASTDPAWIGPAVGQHGLQRTAPGVV